MTHSTIDSPSVYVGTYAKYNNGDLSGDWLSFDEYASLEELEQAARDLHQDEADPELMYQDCEGMPRSVYSESSLSDAWNYWESVKDLDSDTLEAFTDWVENGSGTFEDFSEFEEAYNGKWHSQTDFAENIVDECYDLSKMGDLARYFDYEAFARDLFMGDYWMSDNGHVFRS